MAASPWTLWIVMVPFALVLLGLAWFLVARPMMRAKGISVAPPGCCTVCKEARPTVKASFTTHGGAVVVWIAHYRRGLMCRDCLDKTYRSSQRQTLVAGWWWWLGPIMTPLTLWSNRTEYRRALAAASKLDLLPARNT